MGEDWTEAEGRRSFVRRGLAGLCACSCGGVMMGPGVAAVEIEDREDAVGGGGPVRPSAPPSPQDTDPMPRRWIAVLASSLADRDPVEARRVLKACSVSHWDHLGMDATVGRFSGNVPGFLDFLRSEWGWIIEYDPEAGLIQVNENKSDCVCPLVGKERTPELGTLCYCSEGFAERLFGAVSGRPARAEVTESILRGGERCRYRIQVEV